MNGIFLLGTCLYLIFWNIQRLSTPLLRSSFWSELQKCLKTRDYLFKSMVLNNIMEQRLTRLVGKQLKQGRSLLPELAELDLIYTATVRQQLELKKLLWTYSSHLAIAVMVPLSFRFALSQKLLFDRHDFFEIALGVIGLCAIGRGLYWLWPTTPFVSEESLWDFTLAFLGEKDCGRWQGPIKKLQRESWLIGLDSSLAQKNLLRHWQISNSLAFERRMALMEDALGPAELGTTLYFTLCFLTMPLLNRFSSLVFAS